MHPLPYLVRVTLFPHGCDDLVCRRKLLVLQYPFKLRVRDLPDLGRYLRTYISFPLFGLVIEFPVKTFLYTDFPALM